MLAHAYSWFTFKEVGTSLLSDLKKVDASLLSSSITYSEWLIANHQAEQSLKTAVRIYRGLHFAQDVSTSAVNASKACLKECETHLNFLARCGKALQKQSPQSLFTLMLNISLEDELGERLITIFRTCLKLNPEMTHSFHLSYLERLSNQGSSQRERDVAIMQAQVATEEMLHTLRITLAGEANPLSLAKIYAQYTDDPIKFTAYILWLREKGVEFNQILRARLLHQFTGYHLHALEDKPLHELNIFYELLARFDLTKPLPEIVRSISWDMRGDDNFFNLLGKTTSQAHAMRHFDNLPLLTRNKHHIRRLIDHFGQPALIESVNQLFLNSEDEFDQFLIDYIHQHPSLLTSDLFKLIGANHHELLKKWAVFINDELFEQCLQTNDLSVLYFLPYKPHWVEQLTEEKVDAFLTLIQMNHEEGKEPDESQLLVSLYQAFMSQLSLSEAFDHPKCGCAEIIFCSLSELCFNHPYLLEDAHLKRTLKQSPYFTRAWKAHTDRVYTSLISEFDCLFQDKISYGSFMSLKGRWHKLYDQLDLGSSGKKIRNGFPQNEIELIVCLFKHATTQPQINLPLLLEALELENRTAEFRTTVLIKILTHIDNPTLRTMIVDQLSLTPESFEEEGIADLLEAVSQGNIGLLTWYLKAIPLNDDLVLQAVSAKQWDMIEHWYSQYEFRSLSTETLDKLLLLTIQSANMDFLNTMLKNRYPFSGHGISVAFSEAAKRDDPIALHKLYVLKPCTNALNAAFNCAVVNKNYASIYFFGRIKHRNPQLSIEVERTFNMAVKNNDMEMVKRLMQFIGNAPTPKMVKKAINKYTGKVSHKEIESYLRELVAPNPTRLALPSMPSRPSCASTDSLARLSLFASPLTPIRRPSDWTKMSPQRTQL